MLAYVRNLASDIGPRPAGSTAEAKARQYILAAFRQAGLQSQEDPVDEVRLSDSTDLVLHSANIVGVLEGKSPRSILIGAHHDSRNAACPGASDDASGVAVLLEAARRLAATPHRHTLVFASFTGEETAGLPGSREFLQSWKGPPFLAAITLDFVGTGKVFIAPFPRPPELWANRLLARAEHGARTGKVSFDPWLVTVPRLLSIPYSSDHESFLERGIPALNLSCQFPAWTYHTPEDVPARVEEETLVATTELVVEMVLALDRGEAVARLQDDGYIPVELGAQVAFLPKTALKLIGVGTALLVMLLLVIRRTEVFSWVSWSEGIRGVLMALPLTALAISGAFGAEGILARMAGVLRPWASHPTAHLVGGFLAMGATFWTATGIFRFVRPTSRAGSYLGAALLLEGLLAGGLAAVGRHDVAFPFWLAMVAMTAASLCDSVARRVAWGILGVVWLLPYLSPTTYRMFLELSGFPVPRFALESVTLVLALPWFLFFEHLCCLPDVLLTGRPGRFWTWPVGAGLAAAAVGALVFNGLHPAYDEGHRVVVQVQESVDTGTSKVETSFSSQDTLRGVRLAGWNDTRLPDSTQASLSIPWNRIHLPDIGLEREVGTDEEIVRLHDPTSGSARLTALTVRSGRPFQVFRGNGWESTREYRRIFLPGAGGSQEVIRIRRGSSEALSSEAVISYAEDLLGLLPQAPGRTFRYSSRLRLSSRIP